MAELNACGPSPHAYILARGRVTDRGEDPELVRRPRQVVLIDLGPVRRGSARHLQRHVEDHAHDRPVPGEGELPKGFPLVFARVLRHVGARARR